MMKKKNIIKLVSKLILFVLIAILWSISTALAIIISRLIYFYDIYNELFLNTANVPLILLITITTFMFLIGLIGIVAIITDNRHMLITFFLLLLALFAFQITLMVIFYVKKQTISNYIQKGFNNSIKHDYINDKNTTTKQIKNAIDYIQSEFKCCGTENYNDWKNSNWYFNRNENEQENDTQVPQSCCVDYRNEDYEILIAKAMIHDNSHNLPVSHKIKIEEKIYCTAKSTIPTKNDNYYTNGCFQKLKKFYLNNFIYITIIIASFQAMQLVALILILILIKYEIKYIQTLNYPPYSNIEVEYESDYIQQQQVTL